MLITVHACLDVYIRHTFEPSGFTLKVPKMLRETSYPQKHETTSRRWFTDSDMDLYIWFIGEMPVRFHLIWNKRGRIQSISWNSETGFNDRRFNAFELLMRLSGAVPLHQENTEFNIAVLANRFLRSCEHIEATQADFIYARLLEYPGRVERSQGQGTAVGSF
jgi:hypothetical protein